LDALRSLTVAALNKRGNLCDLHDGQIRRLWSTIRKRCCGLTW